jgi:hypothetical protein
MFFKGEGFTIPENNSGITKWTDLRANISTQGSSFSISGSGFSEFQNKEYFTLFNTRKSSSNDKYYLVKTLYKTNKGCLDADTPHGTIVYKITSYDLDSLTFNLKGETEIHGKIKGELTFTQTQKGFRL